MAVRVTKSCQPICPRLNRFNKDVAVRLAGRFEWRYQVPEAKVGFYGHVRQYHNLKAEIDQAILDVLESGSYVLGPQLTKFEEELAGDMNVRETVGVNSGTDALLLVFLALGLGPGDEVITTSNTFFATAEAIWLAGATAVFVDSDPKTRNIDVTKIEEAITSKTRAIVPVHLYGLTANMPARSQGSRKPTIYSWWKTARRLSEREVTSLPLGSSATLFA